MASDRQFLVQPLALRTQAVASQSPRVASAGLSLQSILAKVREAGTLPRSPRFIWRETKPEAPRVRPSGTDTMLLFAARARAHRQHCDVWRSTPALERGGAEQLLCV